MKKNRSANRIAAILTCSVGAVVIGFGALALTAAPAEAANFKRPCICPDVWAPVTCDNGVTYSNQCRANCAGATGCVPGWLF